MKAPGLPADQQFFADLFSGLVLNPQLLGRVWFASQPASLPVGSLCIDFPRLDIVLRGEFTDQQQTGDAVKPGVRTDLAWVIVLR